MKTEVNTAIKTTHIESLRKAFESNRQFIQTELGLTGLDYQNKLFELGCRFLEERYPYKTHYKYYTQFAFNPLFWKWWQAEWKHFESQYVQFLKVHQVIFNLNDWISEMQQLVLDNNTDNSYHNIFLKSIANGSEFKI